MTQPESFLDGKVILHPGDCLDVMKTLPSNSIDSIVSDPPYGLGKEPDPLAMLRAWLEGGHYDIPSKSGFMGKEWDLFVPQPAIWKEAYRVLKPGGHIVCFFGTRTYDLGVLAIRLAGFEIRDMASWLYGSGFPKSLDVSKAIDKAAGVVREVVGSKLDLPGYHLHGHDGGEALGHGLSSSTYETRLKSSQITAAVTDAAKQWDGFGTALKPACEPICLARKPLIGTVAENVLQHGTGALNIDGCRVHPGELVGGGGNGRAHNGGRYGAGETNGERPLVEAHNLGRWPANVIHDGSDEVVGAFPQTSSGARVDVGNGRLSGSRSGGAMTGGTCEASEGSASRFFYQVQSDVRCQLCDVNIAANQSRTESTRIGASVHRDVVASPLHESADSEPPSSSRANGVGGCSKECHQPSDVSVLSNAEQWPLSKIVQNVSDAASLCSLCAMGIARALAGVGRSGSAGRVHFNPSIGSSRETILSRSLASYVQHRESTDIILTTTNLRELFGCVFHAIAESISLEKAGSAANTKPEPKRLFYSSKADADDRLGSKHPTVKPLDLMQWLVRLVTPPGGTVLDPFTGTGTTGEAAWREGMRAILIEREPEYQNDIRRRMAHVMAGPEERKRTIAKIKNPNPVNDGLFALLPQPLNLTDEPLPNTAIKAGLPQ